MSSLIDDVLTSLLLRVTYAGLGHLQGPFRTLSYVVPFPKSTVQQISYLEIPVPSLGQTFAHTTAQFLCLSLVLGQKKIQTSFMYRHSLEGKLAHEYSLRTEEAEAQG